MLWTEISITIFTSLLTFGFAYVTAHCTTVDQHPRYLILLMDLLRIELSDRLLARHSRCPQTRPLASPITEAACFQFLSLVLLYYTLVEQKAIDFSENCTNC